ncbi:MAG: hypothetical protein J0H89_04410 [Rhizobiales bacterium]|nr:hypothetical protein [Hyphomicrobiales bacterium]
MARAMVMPPRRLRSEPTHAPRRASLGVTLETIAGVGVAKACGEAALCRLLASDLPRAQSLLPLDKWSALQTLLPFGALQLPQLAPLRAIKPPAFGLLPQGLQALRVGLDRRTRGLLLIVPQLAEFAPLVAIEIVAPGLQRLQPLLLLRIQLPVGGRDVLRGRIWRLLSLQIRAVLALLP